MALRDTVKSYFFPGEDSNYAPAHAGGYQSEVPHLLKKFKWVLIILLVCCLIWPFIEPYLLETEEVTIACDDLPSAISQLKIVYVSDIHDGSQLFSQARLNLLINRINACQADIVLLGGDYASDKLTSAAFFEDLPRISSTYGVYAVAGENDRQPMERTDESASRLRNAMYRLGITLLENEVVSIRVGTGTIYIAGIDDVSTKLDDVEAVAKKVSASDFVIFMAHNPSIITEALSATDQSGNSGWFDLGLFGHTHGGQIPFIENIFNFDGIPARYEGGWLQETRAWLLISNGVGTTGFPARLFCKPQIHLITVTPGT